MKAPVPHDQLLAFEDYLHRHFEQIPKAGLFTNNKGHFQLIESIKYSLFSGGKRFRPTIGFLLGKALNVQDQLLMPWLAAIECIHTYSLIHDDLPSMDNDSMRRGQPTNHVLFGESTALLAGDALLTEAFSIISQKYLEVPDLGLSLVQTLALASGVSGMVGGQALDLAINETILSQIELELIHQLKTGALIRAVVEGVSQLARTTIEDHIQLIQFGVHLGFAFQLKDDLLDYQPQAYDSKNIVCHLGLTKTKDFLELISKKACEPLQFLGHAATPLIQLVDYNIQRTQ